ncbi:MAG: multiubiquitin domain-containing protein [Ferruginibacter sp.]
MSNNNTDPKEIIIKIDLEEIFHGRQKHPHNHADPGTIIYYLFKVDKMSFEKKEHEFTGRQLLALVGLTPDKYRLFQIGEGHKEILPDQKVDLRECGIERFKSVAKQANEGKEAAAQAASLPMKRMFSLLAEDEAFLNKNFPNWETIKVANTGWILIHQFEIVDGYNNKEVTVAFMVPPSYPTTEFDMMYFYPDLCRADGKPIGALSHQNLEGKNYQRWSRHRVAGEWRSGVDNLETHVLSVQSWLIDELKKR